MVERGLEQSGTERVEGTQQLQKHESKVAFEGIVNRRLDGSGRHLRRHTAANAFLGVGGSTRETAKPPRDQ